MIGFGGDTEISQQILAGVANVEDITDDEAGQILLQSMYRDSPPLDFDFIAIDMMNRYKKWKEKTITSVPSGRHLGHYHALFRAFEFSDGDDYEAIVEKREKSSNYITSCSAFPPTINMYTSVGKQ